MTYYIYELKDGRQIGVYEPDGRNEVILISERSSIIRRKMYVSSEAKRLISYLSEK